MFVCVYLCVCVDVCVFVLSITAKPFNLEVSNLLQKIRLVNKMFSQIFEQLFFPELLPFFWFSLRFISNFEE